MNKKQFLCYLLAVMLLLTDVTVSAAVFSDSSGSVSGSIFSSGEDVFSTNPQETPGGTVTPIPTVVPEPTPTEIPEITEIPSPTVIPEPTPTETPEVSVTPIPTQIPEEEIEIFPTPSVEPTETPEVSVTPVPTEIPEVSPTPTPTVIPQERVITLVFCDAEGNAYENLSIQVKLEEEILLPDVPGRELASGTGWKFEKEIPDEDAVILQVRKAFRLSESDEYVMEHIVEEELKLYAVKGEDPCTVTFYNNGGSGIFQKQTVERGTVITIPDFPKAGYSNHGWAVNKGSNTVVYHFGDSLEVNQDVKLYIVRYALLDVIFKGPTGSYTASYKKLSTTVEKSTVIQLPAVPVVKGYQNLGWAAEPNATKATWTEGQSVKVTSAKTYYAVRKKVGTYTVNFYNHKGNANKNFKALSATVTKNGTFQLPEVPKASGYTAIGWALSTNQTSAKFKEGQIVTISKNTSFYAVYKKNVEVVLRKNNGAVWKTVTVAKDSYYKLPGTSSKLPYTMMGWSSKSGMTSAPEYEVGEQVKVSSSMHFYAVVFNRNKEKNYSAAELQEPTLKNKYKQVIFVGDSRTNRMQLTLRLSGLSLSSEKVSFVYREGYGLSWLKAEGYTQLLETIGNGKRGKSTAVIFNLGINDLENISGYVSYLKKISTELKERNCELYLMSVNPVNNVLVNARGKKDRPEETIRNFNTVMQRNLCKESVGYTYIDSYSYLMQYGYGTDGSGYGYDIGVDDGLHYTVKTYKRIYRYCIKSILK